MIDRNAVLCVLAGMLILLVGWALLMLMDWVGGSNRARPLKEKPKQQKKRRRVAQFDPSNDSRFRRPGAPAIPPRKDAPIFGEGKPRHVRIDNTPHVIIPHETVGPAPGHSSYRRSMPAVKIKPVTGPLSNKDKPDKSNRTMPLKRLP